MTTIRCGGMSIKRFTVMEDADYIEPLSRGDFSAFCDYVAALNSHVNRGFHIKISQQHCDPDCVAEVETDFNYRRITVALCPQFHLFPPEQKRSIITHELCHPVASCIKMPYDGLESIVSADVWLTTSATAMAMEEHMVTGLEWLLAPHMPLPPDISLKAPPKIPKPRKRALK